MRTISVPPPLLALAAEHDGMVSHRQCDEAGLHRGARTRLVESGRWFRVNRGVYLIRGLVPPPATVSAEWSLHHRRQVWATLLARPDDAVPVGLTALALHRVWGLPRNLGCEVGTAAGQVDTPSVGPGPAGRMSPCLRSSLPSSSVTSCGSPAGAI